MKKSILEIRADMFIRAAMTTHALFDTLEKEYKFHPTRRWRFDFAFLQHKIAVEIEGGIWSGGRHTRGSGFEEDCEKYNEAAKMGWTVLRYTAKTIPQIPKDLHMIFDKHQNWRVKIENMLEKELKLWETVAPTEYEKGGAKAVRGLRNWLKEINDDLGRD